MAYLEWDGLVASLVRIGAVDLELLCDELCQPGGHLEHLLLALAAVRLLHEALLARHVTGHALQDRREQEPGT